jgi:hypothetical protein
MLQQGNQAHSDDDPNNATGIVFIPRGLAASLQTYSGYTKADVKKKLWEYSTTKDATGKEIYRVARPEQVTLVVAGGDQSGHGYWMQGGYSNWRLVSKKIELPEKAKWDALLAQAVTDMGPIPAAH